MNKFAVTTLVISMAATLAATTVAAQERSRGEGRGQRAAAAQGDTTTAGQRNRSGTRRSDATAASRSTSPTSSASRTSAPSTSAPTQWGRGNNRTLGIDRRQSHQNTWISWGRRTGSLTGEEARALRAQQQHIAEMERRAKADGHVTRNERIGIRQAQREAAHDIRREMRDRDRRGRGWHRGNPRRWW